MEDYQSQQAPFEFVFVMLEALRTVRSPIACCEMWRHILWRRTSGNIIVLFLYFVSQRAVNGRQVEDIYMACKDLIVPVMSATSLRRHLSSFDASFFLRPTSAQFAHFFFFAQGLVRRTVDQNDMSKIDAKLKDERTPFAA